MITLQDSLPIIQMVDPSDVFGEVFISKTHFWQHGSMSPECFL